MTAAAIPARPVSAGVPAYELERARQTGRWMRDAHKDRNAVPFYAMGEDGLALRRAWLADWDERDEQIRRKG